MKRRLLQLLTAVSLLVFLASAAFAVRSVWTCDTIIRTRGVFSSLDAGPASSYSDIRVLQISRGGISLQHERDSMPFISDFRIGDSFSWQNSPPTEYPYFQAFFAPIAPRPQLHFMGFEFLWRTTQEERIDHHFQSITVPLPVIALLAAWLPTVAFRRWLKRRSIKPGHCANCGYDLRASPGRCPECGAVPAAIAQA